MIIRAKNVSFRYSRTTNMALENLDFEMRDGEIFGFLGPSGAGKSTTLGILTGTLDGWFGTVEVNGRNPAEADGDFYRDIGVCFESPRFYMKFSAEENLRLFGALYGQPLRDTGELMDRLGLSNERNKKVEAYSKGMKTRLSLVRSLLHDPSLLFLDEPTNGLDPSLSQTVCNLILDERRRGKSIFLTTHDMLAAGTLCDRVGFLVDGKLVLTDRPENLAQKFGKREIRVVTGNHEQSDERGSRIPAHQDFVDFPIEGLADNEKFHTLLRSGEVETIHSREAALNEIFQLVTGRALT